MPAISDNEAILVVKALEHYASLIATTQEDDQYKALITKLAPEPPAEFLQCKDAACVTPREREVVRLICRGLRNKQIAEHLHIRPGTVKVHLTHIFAKTGMKNRFTLAVHGRELAGMDVPASEADDGGARRSAAR